MNQVGAKSEVGTLYRERASEVVIPGTAAGHKTPERFLKKTQCVRKLNDSQRNKSTLHKLSFL